MLQKNLLVLEIGRRRHIVLSVDQLVPQPIVWEQHEVVVGELHAGVGRSDRRSPARAPFYARYTFVNA